MSYQTNKFSTAVCLSLIILTILTFGIGEKGLTGKLVMLSLLAISFIKGQLIANYFMGLRHVSWLWRGIIMGYFLIVGCLIAIAYTIS
ncbi:MAG: cytochrome C oxidase subunit IV family protein [Candidatus Methylopumilus sp.]